MSNRNPGQPPGQSPYRHPGSYPGGHQGSGPYPPAPGAWSGPPPEEPKRKGRAGAIFAIVGVVVLVAAVATGAVMFLGGGDDRPEMKPAADTWQLTFPDLTRLGYDQGPEAMCATVGEVMAARGYEFAQVGEPPAITCIFRTPGLSLLEDGALDLNVHLSAFRGERAVPAYENTLEGATRTQEKFASDSETVVGDLQELPVGDEGFFYHSDKNPGRDPNAWSNATVAIRSGDDTILMNFSAKINRIGKDARSEQVPQDITYGEAIDVLKALNGDESTGEPRIAKPSLEEYPGLPGWTGPVLPEGADGEQRCAPVTSAADKLGMAVEKTETGSNHSTSEFTLCNYTIETELEAGDTAGAIRLTATEYAPDDGLSPTFEFGEDLELLLDQAEEEPSEHLERKYGPLYELPTESGSGYLIYSVTARGSGSSEAYLDAAYVTADAYYMIKVSGAKVDDGKLVALPEDQLVDWLVEVLNALDS